MIGSLRRALGVRVFDTLVAVGLTLLILASALLVAAENGGLGLFDYVLIAGALVLAFRHRAPRLVLVAALLLLVLYLGEGHEGPAFVLPALFALFTAVRTGHGGFAVWVVVPFAVVATLGVLFAGGQSVAASVEESFLQTGWFVAAGAMGSAVRQWQAYTREAEQRAEEAERTRDEAALRRAGEERLRIARELHDSLTHAISVIKVQAGVALHLARKKGEEVPEALVVIQEASGAATSELRETLEVLRETGPDTPDPYATLTRLDELVRSARATGLTVTTEVEGAEQPLPEAVDRAAFRIIQEALTNATRHAGEGAHAVVGLTRDAGTLTVQVADDGDGLPVTPPAPGSGLRGMRERVAALDGRLTAEPRAGGGFLVRAELPLDHSDVPLVAPAKEGPA